MSITPPQALAAGCNPGWGGDEVKVGPAWLGAAEECAAHRRETAPALLAKTRSVYNHLQEVRAEGEQEAISWTTETDPKMAFLPKTHRTAQSRWEVQWTLRRSQEGKCCLPLAWRTNEDG